MLEDRGSYLFWKWVRPGGRASGAAPQVRGAARFVAAGATGSKRTRGASDVAVGARRFVGCEVGGQDGFDRVDVAILWSARFGGSSEPTPSQTVMRLARRSGVAVEAVDDGARLSGVRRAADDSDSSKCDHCGAELAAGDQAWVLEGVA